MLARSGIRTKRIWTLIFQRSGGNGTYTRTFEDLDPSHQRKLAVLANMLEAEIPVIGSFKDETQWLLLTADRVVFKNGGSISEIAVNELANVKLDVRNLLTKGSGKMRIHQLILIKERGDNCVVSLEPGRLLIGVLSILQNVRSRNRTARKTAELETKGHEDRREVGG